MEMFPDAQVIKAVLETLLGKYARAWYTGTEDSIVPIQFSMTLLKLLKTVCEGNGLEAEAEPLREKAGQCYAAMQAEAKRLRLL